MAVLWGMAASVLVCFGFYDGLPLCDDAFYYFEIARNAASGQGFTFDSLGPTNGFHPLWAVALIPLFRIFPHSPWIPVRISLILSAWFMVGAGLLLFSAFRKAEKNRAGLLAMGIWLLNPFSVVLGFQGMEEPLSVLCMAWSFAELTRLRGCDREGRGYTPLRLGLSLGLSMLARTENILWCLSVLLTLVWDCDRGRGILKAWRLWAKIICPACAALAPWIAWNLATFGGLQQTSGMAKQMFHLYGRLPDLDAQAGLLAVPLLGTLAAGIRNIGLILLFMARYAMKEDFQPGPLGVRFLIGSCVAVSIFFLVPWIMARRRDPDSKAREIRLLPLGLFAMFHIVVYAMILRSYASWYFLPLVFVWAAKQAGLVARLSSAWRKLATALIFSLILPATLGTWALNVLPRRPFWYEGYYRYHFLGRMQGVPDGTVAGLWNAGMVGYFSSFYRDRVVIVNLDGVVNNKVTECRNEGEIETYLLDEVRVLLEPPDLLTQMIGVPRAQRFFQGHIDFRDNLWWIRR